MLPEIDGLAVLRARPPDGPTRRSSSCRRAARPTTGSRASSAGADDYLPKPFSPAELVAPGRAGPAPGGRRARGSTPDPRADPAHGDLVVDPERHEVRVGGRLVALTAVEFRLLAALLEADGRVLTRDQLLDARLRARTRREVLDRTIDVHIGRLRDKLGDDADAPRYVATVRGVGYRAARPRRAPSGRPMIGPAAGGIATRIALAALAVARLAVAIVALGVMLVGGRLVHRAHDRARRPPPSRASAMFDDSRRPASSSRRSSSPSSPRWGWRSLLGARLARPLRRHGPGRPPDRRGRLRGAGPTRGARGGRQPRRFVQPDGRCASRSRSGCAASSSPTPRTSCGRR